MPGPSGLELDTRLTDLLCKRINVAKSDEVKNGSNLAEFSREGCGSESVVMLIMMIRNPVISA
jgi:hypothetical protein